MKSEYMGYIQCTSKLSCCTKQGLYLHLLFLKGCIFFTKNCNVVVDVNKFCFYVSDENNNMCLLCMLFVFQLSNYYPLDEKKS